jgi:acetolactate synthase-1/2/3 large subunit
LLYFGNGVRGESALAKARELVEKYQIPFCLSWSALDLFEDAHPLNMGRIGIYGDRASNIILQQADLLLTLGTRLAIPQIGYDKKDIIFLLLLINLVLAGNSIKFQILIYCIKN